LDTQLDEPSLVHLVKGLMLRDLGRYDAAAEEFHAVDHKGLPPHVRVLAMREEGLALHAAGKSPLGIARLVTALGINETDPPTLEALAALRASIGLDPDGHPFPAPPVVEPAPMPVSEPMPEPVPMPEPMPEPEPAPEPGPEPGPEPAPMPGPEPVPPPGPEPVPPPEPQPIPPGGG
jgi:outer membrane biosynthesis protein TonB